ncbi:MAG: arginine repressor [Clostridia bacterium]|nr:arginine repressor [Clostridia bacterium]
MKTKRHSAIMKIITSQNVETQEELAGILSTLGFTVTQATVSRDIKELRLIKVLTNEGRYKYATVDKAESDMQERFIRLFANCVMSVTSAGNIIVVKTMAGSASVAGEAIDSLKWPEIAGSIAGDNTIFVAIREGKNVAEIVKRFQKMLKS